MLTDSEMTTQRKEQRMNVNGANQRILAITLRCLGTLDMFAVAAILTPRSGLVAAALSVRLTLSPEPLPIYLARTASALYALHGAIVFFVSFDVMRYWPLIRFMAVAALVHGAVVIAFDLVVGMPLWWLALEGPGIMATGALVLLLQRQSAQRSP